MPQQIIINADDYGYTAGVSAGIREVFGHGTISSATVMANIPDIGTAIAQAQQETPALPLGVHLVLTFRKPLTAPEKVPSLVNSNGDFMALSELEADPTRVRADEVLREWCEQVELLLAHGVEIDHLDSHHHSAYLHPHLADVMLRVAARYTLTVRHPPRRSRSDVLDLFKDNSFGIRMPDLLITDLFEGSTVEKLKDIIKTIPPSIISEIMVHPAYVDADLIAKSSYALPRRNELRTLLDPGLPAFLKSSGVKLVSFREAFLE